VKHPLMQERPIRPNNRTGAKRPHSARLRFAVQGRSPRKISSTPHLIGIAAICGALFLFAVLLSGKRGEGPDIKTPKADPELKTVRRATSVESDYLNHELPPPANLCAEGKQADALFSQAAKIVSDWRKTGSPELLKQANSILGQAVDLYREAAEAMPDDRYVERRLKQANQLHYTVMKSSSM